MSLCSREDDLLDAVIGLAPNLFYGTGIPASIGRDEVADAQRLAREWDAAHPREP